MSFVASDCACVVVNTKSRRKAFDKTLLLSAAAVALIASPAAQANPVGGAVTTGSASVSTSANKTNVNQRSEDVVIDWSSFNIGSGQTTQFVQPNAQAIAVNRVGGANASQILGALDANGRVVLINGNGVLFGKGAQVNVGSLIATSTDGSDSDVLSGKFTQAGKQNASVINNGAIAAASGGVVALVAPNVTNAGTVNAKLGTVALGAANKFTVDFAGDGLVSFAAQGDVNARASAINTGLLSGANVSMTARAANGIATGVVNMSGVILAQGVQNVGGTIYLNAGNGTLTTTGTLNAAGAVGGGRIETSGETANISGHISAGQGGLWKVDPEDLTIDSTAATTIDGALNGGTSVLEQTTSGAASGTGNKTSGEGDINVESALSWNTMATLTLDAYHSLNILAPISITGGGGLVLQYNDAATDGVLSFGLGSTGFAGSVAFTDVVGSDTQGGLTINGLAYTLANSITQLASDISSNANGNFALANSYDASGDGYYTSSPISTTFAGTFEGLGNTISNLNVVDGVDSNVGLFSQIGGSGVVRDLALAGGTVGSRLKRSDVGALAGDDAGLILNVQSNVWVSGTWTNVGGIVGDLTGTIENASSSGNVSGDINTDAGGLVGYNDSGNILNSSASGIVNATSEADAGGLVGYSYIGVISNSWATGLVSTTFEASAGGLVGVQYEGSITGSHATGMTSVSYDADAGGLAGYDFEAPINSSYATGAVTAGAGGFADAGGLLGELYQGTIQKTYATGTVTGGSGDTVGGLVGTNDGTIEQSFATGAVTGGSGSEVGGLAGENDASILEAYAIGAVGGTSAAEVGGLVGLNVSGATIAQTYATGYVAPGSGTSIGGLVGTDNASAGSITYSYWDTDTTGISDPSQGAGNVASDPGITGLSTAQFLQASNFTGFSFGANAGGSTCSSGGACWVIVDTDNSLNNAGGAAGASLPMLLSEWSQTIFNPHQIELMALDPTASYTLAANVDFVTGPGNFVPGNINIIAPLGWSGAYTLTLDSHQSVNIDAPVTISGAGGLVLITNDNGGSGGALNFAYGATGFTGNVAFTDVVGSATQGSLTINGNSYTLENNVAGLAGDIQLNPGGYFALANGYDASADGTYSSAPIPTIFTGVFEGLGNTISNLGIFANTYPGDEDIGLFTTVSGNISDLALSGSITGSTNVGALSGYDSGNVTNVHSTMAVTGFGQVGGLIGESLGKVTNSSSSGTVTGRLVDFTTSGEPEAIGGLIGQVDTGSVTGSYATGNITAPGGYQIGGLIGVTNNSNNVTVSNSYATGNVAAGLDSSTFIAGDNVGGLIGDNGGAVIDSYATGSVLGTQNVGGLIGLNENDAGGTSESNPTGDGTIVNSYATGAVTGYLDSFGNDGIDVGGLIGYNEGAVANAYAMGTVTGGDQLGGLIGSNTGSLYSVYSTGLVQAAVGAAPTEMGGLVGEDDSAGGIQYAYWDTETSGIAGLSQGAGNTANDPGITGETTSALQGALPAGFSNTTWGTGAGLYPYLLWQYPSGTPQAVSGIAYSNGGGTVLQGGTVSALLDGAALGTASTGANGYYYLLAAPGTISDSNNAVLADSSANGARVDTATDALDTNNNVSGFDVWGNTLIAPTSDTTYSTASATSLQTQDSTLIAQAVGGNTDPTTGLANYGYIATGASFIIDQPLTLSNGLYVKTTNGNIGVDDALTLPGSEGLALESSGALTIDAPINVTGAGAVVLDAAYDTVSVPGNSVLELSFGSGDNIAYAVGSGEGISGQSLTVNGASYTLVYSATDLQNINNNLNGNYALANALDMSSATNWIPLGVNGSGGVQNSFNGFNGIFEGLGNTISNFSLDLPGEPYVGLFGYAGGAATIRDLALAGGSITGTGYADEGALVAYDFGIVANAQSNLAINGVSGDLGGLVGYMDGDSPEIVNSSSSGTITATGGADAGGLVGYTAGTILSSYATGPVTAGAGADIGGLVGYAEGNVENSYATGNVTATSNPDIGGLVGYADGNIENSYAMGNIVATIDTDSGGLVGYSHGSITGSHATGSLSVGSGADAGGLSGYANELVENSYATGAVTAGDSSYTGGLTGYNSGEIENSYAAGLASAGGSSHVGGLTGESYGGITQSYATGGANGGASSFVGGMAGVNGGSAITKSFATGAVTGGSNSDVGGLVGLNQASVAEAYAMGSVGGTSAADVGGLVGDNGGSITQAYATGFIAPGSGASVGGLLGYDVASPGSVTYSYWDIGTTGITSLSQGAGNAANDSGITGKTTANLQGTLPTGFNNAVWATGPRLYPYFLWQFSSTPQAVSGFTVASNGSTDISGLDVSLLVNGASVTPAIATSSGANGYYYLLLAPGTISNSGSPVFAYLTNGTPGNSYVGNALGGEGNLEIEEGQLRVRSGASSVTGLFRALNTAVGSNTGSDFLYTSAGGLASNTNLFLDDSTSTFNVNAELDVGTGTFWFYDPKGAISESGGGTITAGLLRGTTKNGVTLNGANEIAALGGFTNTGTGGFSLMDGETLAIRGALNAGSGGLLLTTTAGDIVLDGSLTTGGTLTLASAGLIWQDAASSVITAAALTGSSNGVTKLQGANLITDLGAFTNTGGNFYLTNAQTLTVDGTVNAGSKVMSLKATSGDLNINDTLDAGNLTLVSSLGEVDGTGAITANVINVTADTGINLDGTNNDIRRIGTNSTNSGPDVINQ